MFAKGGRMLDKRNTITTLSAKPVRVITSAMLAVALSVTPLVSPLAAYATSTETAAEISSAQSQIEEATAAYDAATAKLAELQQQIEENEASIADIEARIPEAKAKASGAMRAIYKSQKSSNSVVSIFVNARNLSDLISTYMYSSSINEANNEAIEELNSMEEELGQKEDALNQAKADLETEQANAEAALAQAQTLRANALAKAQAELEAELAAMAADTEAAEGTGVSGENANSQATESNQTIDASASSSVSGAVDFSIGYDAFMSEWTARIDNYLAGSPLAGYGSVFAQASWNTGVDPRWSPAISCIESTKGTYCANICNAWGWSAVGGGWRSFGDWTSAIYAHVSYLGSCYGSTVTPAAARKYCPPTWQDWFNKVSGQMALI